MKWLSFLSGCTTPFSLNVTHLSAGHNYLMSPQNTTENFRFLLFYIKIGFVEAVIVSLRPFALTLNEYLRFKILAAFIRTYITYYAAQTNYIVVNCNYRKWTEFDFQLNLNNYMLLPWSVHLIKFMFNYVACCLYMQFSRKMHLLWVGQCASLVRSK